MIDSSTSTNDKEKIKTNLLAYCGQDTLAMVKIREELLKKFDLSESSAIRLYSKLVADAIAEGRKSAQVALPEGEDEYVEVEEEQAKVKVKAKPKAKTKAKAKTKKKVATPAKSEETPTPEESAEASEGEGEA